MRWWGWGDPRHGGALPGHALRFLEQIFGVAPHPRPPVALQDVRLDAPSLPQAALARLRDILGAEHLRDDHADRVAHAAGKGYPDLVRLRAGVPDGAPDAVAYPSSREQLRALLAVCQSHSIAVVPFGGGTSVVGGVAPLKGAHSGVLALDMERLDAVLDLDADSRLLTVEAGLRASALERQLAPKGFTLGHFPQSFEYVSLGGCAATRSAGQASTGYGRFEQMVRGLGLCAPAGTIDLPAVPASAAGPDLREAIIGSEGTIGVIDKLTLRVRPVPDERMYEGFFFESFQAGMQALRELAQQRASPDVARLSDEHETRMSLALAGSDRLKDRAGRLYLRVRGYGEGCLAIFGFEDKADAARSRQRHARAVARAHGALPVGASVGRAWLASRFSAPYLRDDLLTHGVMVETLETATTWSNLAALRERVGSAISKTLAQWGTPGLVMCHVSHVYETGASLYFTFLARQSEGREIEQWQAVKRAATDAIVEGGGTLTHHHAIGHDHAPWLEREIGATGVQALRALKAELDPQGIMNPGKLLG